MSSSNKKVATVAPTENSEKRVRKRKPATTKRKKCFPPPRDVIRVSLIGFFSFHDYSQLQHLDTWVQDTHKKGTRWLDQKLLKTYGNTTSLSMGGSKRHGVAHKKWHIKDQELGPLHDVNSASYVPYLIRSPPTGVILSPMPPEYYSVMIDPKVDEFCSSGFIFENFQPDDAQVDNFLEMQARIEPTTCNYIRSYLQRTEQEDSEQQMDIQQQDVVEGDEI